MSARLPESRNDAPDHSVDGAWVDPLASPEGGMPKPVRLPERRSPGDARKGKAAAETGLRIDSMVTRAESVRRLEVAELGGGGVVRLEQAEASPPKVERHYTFHEKPPVQSGGKNVPGEGREWGTVQLHPVRWILGMGGIVTALIILVFLLLPSINSSNAPTRDPNAVALTVEEAEEIEGMAAVDDILERLPEAIQIFRAYSQASLIEDVVPLVKNGKELEATLRRHWKPLGVPSSWAPSDSSYWSVEKLSGKPYGMLQVELPDFLQMTAYFTLDAGRLMMDWKATNAFGTAPFNRLVEGKGDASEVRGEISMADYYSPSWPEEQYRSFRLTSPDGDTWLWVYAPIGDAAEAALAPLFNRGDILEESKNSLKVTLGLERGSPGSLPNQWLIKEAISADWTTR